MASSIETTSTTTTLKNNGSTYLSVDTNDVVTMNVASLNGGQLAGNRNVIINGDFNIWQRGTSFAAPADVAYSADRWCSRNNTAAVFTISRSTDVPTVAEAGSLFNYSLLLDCTTADASVAAGDWVTIEQRVEGFNWLAVAQKICTLSFWVKATKTGIYCASLRSSTGDRSCVVEFTINSTATWEYKTITFPASPSGGTWDYTTGKGVHIDIALMNGTTRQTTAGAWQTGNFVSTSNQVNAMDNTANDFRICGVQLEEGSVATPFEHRGYGTELALCQRYFQKMISPPLRGLVTSDTRASYMAMPLSPTMRAAPTAAFAGTLNFADGTNTGNYSSTHASTLAADRVQFNFSLTAGFTHLNPAVLLASGSGTMSLSAEL